MDVKFTNAQDVPNIYSVLTTENVDREVVTLEVAEHLPGNIARCISINSTINLQRSTPVKVLGKTIEIPAGEALYGRIINMLGQPIDQKGEIDSDLEMFPIRKKDMGSQVKGGKTKQKSFERMETGIKIIDVLFPVVKGSKTGILGGAALGKSILTMEIIQHIVKKYRGSCVFTGIGERIREGNELYYELLKHEVIDKTMMVFGQMNDPPGGAFRRGHDGGYDGGSHPAQEPGRSFVRGQYFSFYPGGRRDLDLTWPCSFGDGIPADVVRRSQRVP